MPHIHNPREEFSKSTGVGIPLLFMFLFYAANIAMVVFAVLAFFSFRSDYDAQKELMLSTVRGRDTYLSEAVVSDGGSYKIDCGKLSEEQLKYFNKDKLSDMRSGDGESKQEFIASVLDSDAYDPISSKTMVLACISGGLLLWLVLRSLRQIRALY